MTLSFLYEAENQPEQAVATSKQLLRMKSNPQVSERLHRLENGATDPASAKTRLHHIFHKEHECDREDHGCSADCNHDHH